MYLVTGASGQLGLRVVRRCVSLNLPVRAFVRLTSHYEVIKEWGAEIFIGDLQEPRDIAKALQGVTALICCHGSQLIGRHIQAIDYRATLDLIQAAQEQQVRHVTLVSPLAVMGDRHDSPFLKAKYEAEQALIRSGLNYTIFRSATLMSSLLPLAERFQQTGVYVILGEPQHRLQLMSPEDLARCIVIAAQICDQQVFNVAHPEVLTRQEIADRLGRFFNKRPLVMNLPLGVIDGARQFLGLLNRDLEASIGTLRALLAYESLCPASDIERVQHYFQLPLESLEEFLDRYFSAPDRHR
ncbi:NAD(P)H-binding protein [Thermosynechococcaceae cyanobacterium Okahandja]